jgi:hypothetical protein
MHGTGSGVHVDQHQIELVMSGNSMRRAAPPLRGGSSSGFRPIALGGAQLHVLAVTRRE